MAELTGDVGAVVEAAEDLRVDVDGELLLVEELLVPGLHDDSDPLAEGLADIGVDEVDEPLPGDLFPVALVGQVVLHDGVLLRLDEHLLDAEPLVLGHREVVDPILM